MNILITNHRTTMKRLLIFGFCSIFASFCFAQLNNNGASIHVSSGSYIYTDLDVKNTSSGTLTNDGTITTTSNFSNETSATSSGSGNYTVSGDWTNSATFTADNSTVVFDGATASNITSGSNAFHTVEVNKDAGVDVNLVDDASVSNALNFTSDNNKVNLGANNLTVGTAASISGADATDYIVTGSTGYLKKEQLSGSFDFPVGYDNATYNPISVTQAGTADNLSVRCLQNVLENGTTGTALTDDAADASWEVLEDVAGGSDITLTAQWAASDELGVFDRTSSTIYQYETSWTPGTFGAASGADPYTQTRSGITSLGVFAVGGASLEGGVLVDISAFLQGPYNNAGGMDDDLRSSGYLPTDEPYAGFGYTHVFRGGGEAVAASVLAITGTSAVIDWVFIELRDSGDNTNVVATRSALLLADGTITDLDGTSALTFDGVSDGDYYVALKHRNHLGIMTPAANTLSRTATVIDFSGGNTYGGTNVQKLLPDGNYGLYSADVDASGSINAADRSETWNNRNTTGYIQADATLDGSCNAADRSETWNNRNKATAIP